MTPLDWAWFAVAIAVLGVAVAAVFVLVNVYRAVNSVRELVDDAAEQTVPALGELRTTVTLVNQDLARVDGVLSSAERASAALSRTTELLTDVVNGPLVKLGALAWGLRGARRGRTDTRGSGARGSDTGATGTGGSDVTGTATGGGDVPADGVLGSDVNQGNRGRGSR